MLVDLNVVYDDKDGSDVARTRLIKALTIAEDLGYTGVAINTVIQGKIRPGVKSPVDVADIKKRFPRLSIWTRVTVVLDNISQNQSLTPLYSAFDIVAVRPMTEKAFQSAATALDIDLISFDMTQRLPFYVRHKTAGAAVERGVKFEITYASAVTTAAGRRHAISNAAAVIRATRAHGIVISSETSRGLYLRGPYDVVNLAVLWGLDHMRARDALGAKALAVVKNARLRSCTYKQVVAIPADASSSVDSPEERTVKRAKVEP